MQNSRPSTAVTLEPVPAAGRGKVAERSQAAFAAGITDAGPAPGDEPIPSVEGIQHSTAGPAAETLQVAHDGHVVGGAVVRIGDTAGADVDADADHDSAPHPDGEPDLMFRSRKTIG